MNTNFMKECVCAALLSVGIYFSFVFNVYSEPEAYGDELYSERNFVSDSENAGYAIIGITAPKDVSDFHEYGVSLVKEALASGNRGDQGLPLFAPSDNELKVISESEKILCWLGVDKLNVNECLSGSDINTLINNNRKLLSRYLQLHGYSKIDLDVPLSRNDDIIIPIHDIFLSYLNQLMRESKLDTFYTYLFDDIRLWMNLAGQNGSWIQKAIIMKILSDDLRLMEALIDAGKLDISKIRGAGELFSKIGVAGWLFRDAYIYEYRLIELKLCLNDGYDYFSAGSCLNREDSLFYKRSATHKKIITHINYMMKIANSSQKDQTAHCTSDNENVDGVNGEGFLDRLIFNYKGNKVFEQYASYNSLANLCSLLSPLNNIDAAIGSIKEWGDQGDQGVE